MTVPDILIILLLSEELILPIDVFINGLGGLHSLISINALNSHRSSVKDLRSLLINPNGSEYNKDIKIGEKSSNSEILFKLYSTTTAFLLVKSSEVLITSISNS